MITDYIRSTLLSNITLFIYLSLTIKIEQKFGRLSILTESRLSIKNKHLEKLSIHTESRISKENKYLVSYQFEMNQEY